MARGEAALEVKVGVFVFLLIAMSVTVIFLLGRTSNLFEEQVVLRTAFRSASGLRVGAQVRLAGVHVGQVASIHFGTNPRDPRVTVELKVQKAVLPRITQQSRARIDSMGLLGDKIIDISVGEAGKPVEPGAELPGVAPPEYLALLDTAHESLANVKDITAKLREVVGRYMSPKIHDDVVGIFAATRRLLEQVASGRGLVHALLFDKALAQEVRSVASKLGRTLDNANIAIDRFLGQAGLAVAQAFGEVGKILKDVRRRKGTTLHTLLYGKDHVTPIFVEAKRAAETLTRLLADVKESQGLARALLFDPKGREVLENLVAASRSVKDVATRLREVGDKVAKGEGSLGALLHDPSLYEDLKRMVSNLRRNRVLRALIRFAIERQEEPAPERPPSGAK
jgi:phospholipid/cholesterol/gamma-HCH transport system substrate-binding protein